MARAGWQACSLPHGRSAVCDRKTTASGDVSQEPTSTDIDARHGVTGPSRTPGLRNPSTEHETQADEHKSVPDDADEIPRFPRIGLYPPVEMDEAPTHGPTTVPQAVQLSSDTNREAADGAIGRGEREAAPGGEKAKKTKGDELPFTTSRRDRPEIEESGRREIRREVQ